ncbi:sensor histidine kinase [uncultured Pedobacter sp.]|uniref:sensor histidine kinase n=1 Tax=uncultured Pedobacter sp. TaxID=246139 RepID=UPI0025DF7C92|nr:histidine kinase [uncultured Pedobacter sp.]
MSKILECLRTYRLHILIWAIYIAYEVVVTGLFAGVFGSLVNYIIHYLLNISLFYVNAKLISGINVHNGKINYLKYPLLFILEIMVYTLLLAVLNRAFTEYNQPVGKNLLGLDRKFLFGATYRSIFFIMVSSGYAFLIQFINEKKKSEILKINNLEDIIARRTAERNLVSAQNAYLRAQVNPHLFFNALSFVHRRIKKTDDIAGDMVISLADMMRYAVDSNPTQEFTKIKDELEHIRSLCDIFSKLSNDHFNLRMICEVDTMETSIPPLILVTIVENMYKHGNLSDPSDPGILKIYKDANLLRIECENRISGHKQSHSFGTGLKNLADRLSMFSKGENILNFEEKDHRFMLKISIVCLESKALKVFS